jgi:predicted ATPase
MPIHEILDRLDSSLEMLGGGRRTADPRQQTMHGAIEWSYELLSAAERVAFRRLSVFRGGWTLAAAVALFPEPTADRDSALGMITQLAAKSLVMSVATERGARYAMLETIRQHAAAKLQVSGEAA